jgi:molybdopterin converting factor small subunit
MSIRVELSPIFAQHTDNQLVLRAKGSTVGECLDYLIKQFPDLKSAFFDKNGRLYRYIDIYVNGESAYPEELAKPVKNGDKLNILILVAGG